MAVWQVEFNLVPRGAPHSTAGWEGSAFPSDYRDRLSGVLSGGGSEASPGLERWGNEDGNRIDVMTSDGHVRQVSVRVDVRRLDPKFGAALILFVRGVNGVLVRRDGLIVEPAINAYSAALRSSNAWRYASDPIAWLAAQSPDDE